jgi:enamine deaminase RidA (YjgF/YER057c/UK114 family)
MLASDSSSKLGRASSTSCMDMRVLGSADAQEFHLTAVPGPGQSAGDAFAAVAQALRDQGARILQERIFAAPSAVNQLRSIRRQAYGDLCDEVEPSWLGGIDQGLAGIQVHAVKAPASPRVAVWQGRSLARVLEIGPMRWIAASGLVAPRAGDGPAQAYAVFGQMRDLLRSLGADLYSVARTWIFMHKILDWYGPFNSARNRFFLENGLLGPHADGRMPASTGIGVDPCCGSQCLIDFVAVSGGNFVQRLHAAGRQRSAYEYGSAFARAATVQSPAGRTVYVSGTAAIDQSGQTCFLDDAPGQVNMTIENIQAVLRDTGCNAGDVVQAMAYCATPQVEDIFRRAWQQRLGWPCVVLRGDVCRADLLFEAEVTACPGSRPGETG